MLKKLVLVMLVAVLAISVMGVVGFGTDELINYHWWTAGGEKEAIDAVFNLFKIVYPGIDLVENPTSGGGGGIMRAQIKTMILAGNAPDTFQLTYGSGMLASFVDVLEPILLRILALRCR
jgi:glucose/mannose transport system substrate-binding protein